MITFSRSQIIGVEFPDEDTARFHGIQDDHIYAMEVEMDVRISDGVITAIKGWMKRYTTPVCPKAVDLLQNAVGTSLRQPGWMDTVFREIGRKGCEHFAEIINECGRCLDQSRITRDVKAALEDDPAADIQALASQWLREHPEKEGAPLATTK
jgi:hypothetical protein